MYNGIDIEHPVFRVLFCNLIAAFFLSAVNLVAFPFNLEIKYSTIVTGTNASCLIFHCCCWFVVSLLRYLYIIHKDWLLNRYPDPKYLNRVVDLIRKWCMRSSQVVQRERSRARVGGQKECGSNLML